MKKVYPWIEDYFAARVVLGFSEEEFWSSTPRKLYALKACYDKVFRSNGATQSSAVVQAKEIRSLLGL